MDFFELLCFEDGETNMVGSNQYINIVAQEALFALRRFCMDLWRQAFNTIFAKVLLRTARGFDST